MSIITKKTTSLVDYSGIEDEEIIPDGRTAPKAALSVVAGRQLVRIERLSADNKETVRTAVAIWQRVADSMGCRADNAHDVAVLRSYRSSIVLWMWATAPEIEGIVHAFANTIIAKDEHGGLQALARHSQAGEKTYVEELFTAPWNLRLSRQILQPGVLPSALETELATSYAVAEVKGLFSPVYGGGGLCLCIPSIKLHRRMAAAF